MSLLAVVVSDRPRDGGTTVLGWAVATTHLALDDTGLDAIGRAALLRWAAHDLRQRALDARDGAGAIVPTGFRMPTAQGTFVSISHTRGAIAVVLAAAPVGIDVERLDRASDAPRLAARHFAPGEQDGFAWRWTAKEALMKATGAPLRAALATHMGPQAPAPFARFVAGAEITVFAALQGFALAVAITPLRGPRTART